MIWRIKRWWSLYKFHRLHEEPIWLAAWRACKRRARIGTPQYWHR